MISPFLDSYPHPQMDDTSDSKSKAVTGQPFMKRGFLLKNTDRDKEVNTLSLQIEKLVVTEVEKVFAIQTGNEAGKEHVKEDSKQNIKTIAEKGQKDGTDKVEKNDDDKMQEKSFKFNIKPRPGPPKSSRSEAIQVENKSKNENLDENERDGQLPFATADFLFMTKDTLMTLQLRPKTKVRASRNPKSEPEPKSELESELEPELEPELESELEQKPKLRQTHKFLPFQDYGDNHELEAELAKLNVNDEIKDYITITLKRSDKVNTRKPSTGIGEDNESPLKGFNNQSKVENNPPSRRLLNSSNFYAIKPLQRKNKDTSGNDGQLQCETVDYPFRSKNNDDTVQPGVTPTHVSSPKSKPAAISKPEHVGLSLYAYYSTAS